MYLTMSLQRRKKKTEVSIKPKWSTVWQVDISYANWIAWTQANLPTTKCDIALLLQLKNNKPAPSNETHFLCNLYLKKKKLMF